MEETEQEKDQFQGPRIQLSKYHLSFNSKIDETCTDFVTITNTGSTSIYYSWIRKSK